MRISVHRAHKVLLAAVCTAYTCAAADTYCIYTTPNGNEATLRQAAATLLPPRAEVCIKQLPYKCTSKEDAVLQAAAIADGVTELPCLVISDAAGAYAVLRMEGLTHQAIAQAAEAAQAPNRNQQAEQRRLNAEIHLLCAQLGIGEPSDPELEQIVTTCRALLAHPQATTEQQQFIGYRCLYPALLLQYTRGYTGAHTPYTEAKLLEAIAALEAARDLNRETKIGKQAFAERERLRAARREARKYE